MSEKNEKGKIPHLVLYDGVCGLCDRTVQLLLKADRDHKLHFAPLQGKTAEKIFQRHQHKPAADPPESVLFVNHYQTSSEEVSEKSTAAIDIMNVLGGGWMIPAKLLALLPVALRDRIYDWIAANRYDWFGKFDRCKLPSPEQKQHFLE